MEKHLLINNLKVSVFEKLEGSSCVLLIHGFASHKNKKRFEILKNLPSFFAFDFPGNGESEKVPLDFDLYKKVLVEIVRYLKNKGINELIVVAESLGNLVFLSSLKEIKEILKIRALVSIGPVFFPKIPDAVKEHFAELIQNKRIVIGKRRYEITIDFIEQIFSQKINKELIDFPIFVFYGENDEIICLKDIKRFCSDLNCNILVVNNADHVLEDKMYLVYYFVLGLVYEGKSQAKI